MVTEAERYKTEDEAASARIASKNGLESYAYNLQNSTNSLTPLARRNSRILSTRPSRGSTTLTKPRRRSTRRGKRSSRLSPTHHAETVRQCRWCPWCFPQPWWCPRWPPRCWRCWRGGRSQRPHSCPRLTGFTLSERLHPSVPLT